MYFSAFALAGFEIIYAADNSAHDRKYVSDYRFDFSWTYGLRLAVRFRKQHGLF